MNAITEKIKALLKEEESSRVALKNTEFLWVDNYKVTDGEFVLPIAIFYGNGMYYFATGASVYSLKRQYKEITSFEEIARAIWQLYINQ